MDHKPLLVAYFRLGLLLMFTLSLVQVNGQTDDSTPRLGLLVNPNFGFVNFRHPDFIGTEQPGQAAFQEGRYAWERGVEGILLTRSNLMVRADIHRGWATFDQVASTPDADIRWAAHGQSLGIGYGQFGSDDGKDFFVAISMSLGTYRSEYTFVKEETGDGEWLGDVLLEPSSEERFYSNNAFLDLNALFGSCHFWGQNNDRIGLNTFLSAGVRPGLARTQWFWANTDEAVGDLNQTLYLGWYLKFSAGITLRSRA